jgi:hypothetical protein
MCSCCSAKAVDGSGLAFTKLDVSVRDDLTAGLLVVHLACPHTRSSCCIVTALFVRACISFDRTNN